MSDQTSGQRAIHLLRRHGFGATDSGSNRSGGSHAGMADITGRRIVVQLDGGGNLLRATPVGDWTSSIELAIPGWRLGSGVRTVEELAELLERVPPDSCDGYCTGLQHRETCPAYVVVY